MDYLKYLICQTIVLCTACGVFTIFDSYISPPFTRTDLIAACVSIPIQLIIISMFNLIGEKFKAMRMWTKFLLTMPAFIISVFLAGFLRMML